MSLEITVTESPVTNPYCAHCDVHHPARQHLRTAAYTANPYARQEFEARQRDLMHESAEYAAGKLTRAELFAAIERIDSDYLQSMHDLYVHGLI